jgi:hypothetical protein
MASLVNHPGATLEVKNLYNLSENMELNQALS